MFSEQNLSLLRFRRKHLSKCCSAGVKVLKMVIIAQLVRALDCGSGGRGFKSHHPPHHRSRNDLDIPLHPFDTSLDSVPAPYGLNIRPVLGNIPETLSPAASAAVGDHFIPGHLTGQTP